jgi:type II secretory ATPase GspE/PulE/Tfp pilus assembly ATPase PilB-like protein
MRMPWRKKHNSGYQELFPRDTCQSDIEWALKYSMAAYGAKPPSLIVVCGDESEPPPIFRLATTIIEAAIKERASDIHIEPDHRNTRIRYRVDGILHDAMYIPKYIAEPLTTCFEEMAKLKPAVSEMPRTGEIRTSYEKRNLSAYRSCENFGGSHNTG